VSQETTAKADLSLTTAEDLSVQIDLLTVDEPNNKPQSVIVSGNTFFYGAVSNTYQISSNDITVGQYRNFLMAVARTSDPYGLFNTGMQTSPNVASIIKTTNSMVQEGVTSTIATYTVMTNRASLPITYVSYWSAIRFCNWIANGQPTNIVECNPLTTEDGSYCIVDGAPTLRPEATWRLPTENEWFKAAYYDKKTKSYWIYSTGNQAPGNSEAPQENQPNSLFKNANYNLNGTWTASASPWITPVGIFSNSPGPFGTYDMGGNVAQLTDTWQLINDPGSVSGASWKVVTRGGSWRSSTALEISARYGYQYIDPNGPNDGASETIGFRVACSVSEKHTLASTVAYLFNQDASYCQNNDEDSLLFNSGFGYGTGFFTPFFAHLGVYWARTGKIIAEGTEVVAEGGSVCVFGPEEGILFLGYTAVAAIYHFNVNGQTSYDANPVTKRAGVGAFVYDVGATLWKIGGFFF
jgi:formylglycine-generating enzyme required for sulfatase activity